MDNEIAKVVLSLMDQANENLNEALSVIKNGGSEEDFLNNRTEIGKIMLEIYLNVMRPIHNEHSELEPEKLRQSRLCSE